MKKYNSQSGNILIFILIAIGLLGLLTVSLSKSGSDSNDTGEFERDQIAASEILTYAKSIETAVQSLLVRGCSENEISFENNIVAGYTNPNSPTDKSCHIFDAAGAGMTMDNNGEIYSSALQITDVVTTRSELLMIIEDIDENLCGKINTLSKAPAIDEAYITPALFTGGYSSSASIGGVNETQGAQSACFINTNDSSYNFYHVLHAR